MSEKLTPQQLAAVTDRGGKLLVSAAAGSGKTKVLIDRLLSYVLDEKDPANLDDFLIITYTKAAAAELRSKISKKLSERIAQEPNNHHLQRQMQRLYLAKISTVHSFCSDILREYAYMLDISVDFRVADEMECEQLKLLALEQVLFKAYEMAQDDPCFCSFVDSQGFGRDDRQIPEIILKTYNSAMCHLNPKQWLQNSLDAVNTDGLTGAEQTPWGDYLLRDLRNCLNLHINALRSCTKKAEVGEGFDKPVLLLKNTVTQLEALARCSTWDAVVNFGKIDFGRLTFSKKCTDHMLIDQIKAVRNACKKALDKKLSVFSDSSAQILSDLQLSEQATSGLVNLVLAFMEQYGKLKRARRILDFSDLEHRALDLLIGRNRSGPTAAAQEIANRFREVMVDEYQDTNGVQDAIFAALTKKGQNCFMVGDVKQSIYQFRLADPGIFVSKYNTYASVEKAKRGEGRKVFLSSNFRSSEGIISGVNYVFSHCMCAQVGGLEYGEEEMLREGIQHSSLGEPEVELYGIQIEQDTYAEEAAFVAEKITALLDGTHMIRQEDTLRPILPSDVVILLRSPGSVGSEYRFALEQRGIPCSSGDGGDLLLEPEIVVLKSLLQIIDNPLQDIPLIAAMASPVFSFSADELAQLRCRNRRISIYDSVLNGRTEKTDHFIAMVNALRSDARMDTVSELLQHIFSRTDFLQIYCAMPDGKQKSENIHAFCQLASEFENCGRGDLPAFLQYLQGLEERGTGITGTGEVSDGVTIMSIHKSKGLEFPVVFLCGLSRRFNEESVRAQVLCHKELGLGLSCVDLKQRVRYPTVAKRAIAAKILQEGLSEELRVLYVAMTRARDRLIMTYAAKDLASDLQEIAMRMDHSPKALLTSDVSCPGEWILQTAMTRTEAGAFFQLSGHPSGTSLTEPLWRIEVMHAPAVSETAILQQQCLENLEPALIEKMKAGLSFQYPHLGATRVPSKQTATQLKGRWKDREISEGTASVKHYPFRKAHFSAGEVQGKEYGTLMHLVMQHICYANCMSPESVFAEVQRLVKENLLTQEQAQSVDYRHIAAFFQTPIGTRIRLGDNVLREFKFSVLMDAAKYYPEVIGEKILLQGVVDCALVEEDKITLVDFKTDCVSEDTVATVAESYRQQVSAYADAFEEIFEKKVSDAFLYFFKLGKFVRVPR